MRTYLRNNFVFVAFVTGLVILSVFFTVRVEAMRRKGAKARIHEAIASGSTVKVRDVIDGDEVLVLREGGQAFVVRLLGVQAFDPKSQDPDLGGYGRNALDFLLGRTKGREVQLEFSEFALDRSGRLLAYVRLGEEDVGQTLLERGLALAYLKYPSEREAAYVGAEQQARQQAVGLWANQRASERAQALSAAWEARRDD